MRGTGGNYDALTCQVLRRGVEHLTDSLYDVLGLAHAARVHVTAGKVAAAGSHHMDTALAQRGHVGLCRRRLPHAVVHSGCDHDGSRRRKQRGGDKVVGDAVGHLGDDIGGRGRYDHQIGLLRERNMVDGVGRVVEQAHGDGLVGERAEGERTHELRGMLAHNDLDACAALLQQAHDIARLIGGDPAGDAQQDRFSLKLH